MKKITLTNFFERFKPHIPHCPSSEAYGEWFADHTQNWSAKEIARFNSLHVEQILNCHGAVTKMANAYQVQEAIQVIPPLEHNKFNDNDDNAWHQKMSDIARKYNQWGGHAYQDFTAMHMKFERKKFFDGFFNRIKNNSLSVQHLWLFNIGTGHPQIHNALQQVNSSALDMLVEYPWSGEGKARALKQVLNQIWKTNNIDLLSHIVAKKWDALQVVGQVLFDQKIGRQDDKTQFISKAMDLGIAVPVDIIPSLLQSDFNSSDTVLKILYAAPETPRHKMVKVVLPNTVEKDPVFTTQLLSDPHFTPNLSETLVSFFDTGMFTPLFKCINDSEKDSLLATVCASYVKKNKDPSLKKISDFVQQVSGCFPSSEQKMVVLRMFALLVEVKNPEIGVLLGSMVLERAATEEPSNTPSKRKM